MRALVVLDEVRIAAALGPFVAILLLLAERDPCGRIVALHAEPVLGDDLPHLVSRPIVDPVKVVGGHGHLHHVASGSNSSKVASFSTK